MYYSQDMQENIIKRSNLNCLVSSFPCFSLFNFFPPCPQKQEHLLGNSPEPRIIERVIKGQSRRVGRAGGAGRWQRSLQSCVYPVAVDLSVDTGCSLNNNLFKHTRMHLFTQTPKAQVNSKTCFKGFTAGANKDLSR